MVFCASNCGNNRIVFTCNIDEAVPTSSYASYYEFDKRNFYNIRTDLSDMAFRLEDYVLSLQAPK